MGPDKLESRYEESVLASLVEEAPKYHALYGGHPLFVFDPRAFATLLNTGKMAQPAVSHLVLRAILSRIQLRWTMSSKIDLGQDAGTYEPGQDVPIFLIAGVELRMNAWEVS